jgi:hypothetical protein
MKSTAKHIDDSSLSLESAAAALGVSVDRVLRWMENSEWLVLGDTSYDVVQGQLESGNLSARAGGVRVTQQGMETLRREIKPRSRKELVAVGDDQDTPPF